MKKTSAVVAATLSALYSSPLFAESGVEIGQLTCHQVDRSNLVIISEAKYDCMFEAVDGSVERYRGEVSKFGLDLSTSTVETMAWYVLAPSSSDGPRSLAGSYYGASGDASIGAGAGARVLVGGFEDSFSLQPASVTTQEGFGAAAGIEQFVLK